MTLPQTDLEQQLKDALARLEEGDAFGAAAAMSAAEQAVAAMHGVPVDPATMRALRAVHARITAAAESALRALGEEIGRCSAAQRACVTYRSCSGSPSSPE